MLLELYRHLAETDASRQLKNKRIPLLKQRSVATMESVKNLAAIGGELYSVVSLPALSIFLAHQLYRNISKTIVFVQFFVTTT